MSLGDEEKKKDIRSRAEEFLSFGPLGCCPETKAALGKTVADANAPKQPEKKLPNVVNDGGYRYDPRGEWQEGMLLRLFHNNSSTEDLSGEPNFGWMPKEPELSEEEKEKQFLESLKNLANGPRVVQEVWEVDDKGNPTKRVNPKENNTDGEDDLEAKGLGRTLREMNPGNTLIARAAKKFGVWVDAGGKFRCPPGTPQANQFTDDTGSTCFSVSASQAINAAQQGFASIGRWAQRRRQRRSPYEIDEFGNISDNPDYRGPALESAGGYSRVFTGARSRVRKRMAEAETNVEDLFKLFPDIARTSDSNDDLKELIKRLNPNIDISTAPTNVWDKLSESDKKKLLSLVPPVNKKALQDVERGFLMKLAELGLTDPERLSKISKISHEDVIHGGGAEAQTLIDIDGPEPKYRIEYDVLKMAKNVQNQLLVVEANQRLALRAVGATSDDEAADLLHKFVINDEQFAGGMTASLAKNPFLGKGFHTSIHELSHTVQIDKFFQILEEKTGNLDLRKMKTRDLMALMTNMNDGIDLVDLGLFKENLDSVAFLGGAYGRQVYGDDKVGAAVSELWAIETTAELYSLREMGVIEGDDVDNVLSYMDDVGDTKTKTMRDAAKKKNAKILEESYRRPITRPDGRRDTPDSPPPTKPRKVRPVKSPSAAAKVGSDMRTAAMEKLDEHERIAIERVGDPRSHSIFDLANPERIEDAVTSIDSNFRLARRHGADLDEIDVSGSKAVSRVAYDPKKQRLYVTYSGRDGQPGKTYFYRKVSPETVVALHAADAKGTEINSIKKAHSFLAVDKIPEKIERTSLDDADIASQVQFNLIPTLTALDKSEVGREMRVVVSVKGSKTGDTKIDEITTARIYHDGIELGDDDLVLSISADTRGIPVQAGEYDKEKTGSMAMLMLPPMNISIIEDKNGRRAEISDQESSSSTLRRMIDQFPIGRDAKNGRMFNRSRNKVEEIIETHLAMDEGSGRLADGSTSPLSARRIRTRNADIHRKQTNRKSSPTKPTKEYRESVVSRGFPSMGRIETSEERAFGRTSDNASIVKDIRLDAGIDPEIQRLISNIDDRDVTRMLESASMDFHEGIDRRPRLRTSSEELGKIISDGGRVYKDKGHFSGAEKRYQALIGIHPDVDEIDRPVSAYVVHPAQDEAARDAIRRSGKTVGNAPIEWQKGSNPHGDIDADGEIEVILKPEVSGRTAYGFGYGIDNKTRPVWMNSSDHKAVADAIVHVDPVLDPEGAKMRVLNALSSQVDGDYGSLTDIGSVKPAATSQNEKTSDYAKRLVDHSKARKPQRLGAQIMGGFVNEEISEIRYPWSRVTGSASDIDISDVVNKEPVSDRLRRLGFTNEEIEFFYSMNGDRSLDYISSATMSSLREYRKAKNIQAEYKEKGIPMVSFAHPAGLDPMDISSYSANSSSKITIEGALAKAINEEVDALIEKMLKQVRKTRGKIWEMNPKVGASR